MECLLTGELRTRRCDVKLRPRTVLDINVQRLLWKTVGCRDIWISQSTDVVVFNVVRSKGGDIQIDFRLETFQKYRCWKSTTNSENAENIRQVLSHLCVSGQKPIVRLFSPHWWGQTCRVFSAFWAFGFEMSDDIFKWWGGYETWMPSSLPNVSTDGFIIKWRKNSPIPDNLGFHSSEVLCGSWGKITTWLIYVGYSIPSFSQFWKVCLLSVTKKQWTPWFYGSSNRKPS